MRIHKLKHGYKNLTAAKARLIAHLIADGCVFRSGTNYYLRYEVADEESKSAFARDIESVYGITPQRALNKSGKTGKMLTAVFIRSKQAYYDMLQYCSFDSFNWRVPAAITEASDEIVREFLRAYFDDEATIYKRKGRVHLRAYSVNKPGLLHIQLLLLRFGISSIMRPGYGSRRNVYGLEIHQPQVFTQEVGFSLCRKNILLPREQNPPSQI